MSPLSRMARTAALLFSRNRLVRPGDRVESALLCLAVLLMLAAVPVAAAVGTVVHADRSASARIEHLTRHPVPATVLEDTVVTVDWQGVAAASATAKARWRAPDGTTRTGLVVTDPGLKPGDTTTIWVDQGGTRVPAPRTEATVLGDATATALGVLVATATGLVVLCGLARLVRLTRARTRWERQWRSVEPQWSGRVGRGPA